MDWTRVTTGTCIGSCCRVLELVWSEELILNNSPCSSEDEIDVILHGTPEARRRLRRRSIGQKSSSEDEFEKEMEKELNSKMSTLESEYGR